MIRLPQLANTVWLVKCLRFVALSGLPVLIIYAVNLAFLERADLDAVSPLYPTLAIFSLALEFGIPTLIVVMRIKPTQMIVSALGRAEFHALFVLAVCAMFVLANMAVNRESLENVFLFPYFIVYAYAGLCVSIARGVYDRVGNHARSLTVRYLSNIGTAAGFFLSVNEFGDVLPMCAVILFRFPYVFSCLHFYRRRSGAHGDINQRAATALRKMFLVSMVTFLVSGFAFRYYIAMTFNSEDIVLFALSADLCIRISGFLIQALQPFYKNLRRAITPHALVVAMSVPLVWMLDYIVADILVITGLLVTTALVLQVLVEREQFLSRGAFPVVELGLFVLITQCAVAIGASLAILRFWEISQSAAVITLIIIKAYLERKRTTRTA